MIGKPAADRAGTRAPTRPAGFGSPKMSYPDVRVYTGGPEYGAQCLDPCPANRPYREAGSLKRECRTPMSG